MIKATTQWVKWDGEKFEDVDVAYYDDDNVYLETTEPDGTIVLDSEYIGCDFPFGKKYCKSRKRGLQHLVERLTGEVSYYHGQCVQARNKLEMLEAQLSALEDEK